MRNPILSYYLVCESCKESNKAKGVNKWTKQRLYKRHGSYVNIKCLSCGFTPQHINRLYAELNLKIVTPLLFSFAAASYWLGGYLFKTYWRDNPMLENDIIIIVLMGYISPLAIGGLVLSMLVKMRESFNIRI